MIIKKINGSYLPEVDRMILKITLENDGLKKDQFQLILTRRIVKSMMQAFKTKIHENPFVAKRKKINETKNEKDPAEISQVFGPHLVKSFSLSKTQSGFLMRLNLNKDQNFQMHCAPKILELLLNLFMKLQEKASWDLNNILISKKQTQVKRVLKPAKRTLH
jgi:hypothetical protein